MKSSPLPLVVRVLSGAAAVVACLSGATMYAQSGSTVLASIKVSLGSNSVAGLIDSLAFHFGLDQPNGAFGTWTVGPLTHADIGRTFIGDASTVPQYLELDFQVLKDLLTDGLPSIIEVEVGPFPSGGGGRAAFEQTVFSGVIPEFRGEAFVPLSSGHDLQGHEISAFRMTIRDVVVAHDLVTQRTRFNGAFTLDVIGGPLVMVVQIDIMPETSPNRINLRSRGVVPVAILSSATFDAQSIDPATVTLAGAAVKAPGRSGRRLCDVDDVNADGLGDLVCRVNAGELELEIGDTTAVLEAVTLAGRSVTGQDSVRIAR